MRNGHAEHNGCSRRAFIALVPVVAEEAGCIGFVGMIYHGYAVTHLDAPCHIFTPEGKQGSRC